MVVAKRKAAGFTLLELLVVMSLVVLVMAVVGANLRNSSGSVQLKTQARQLIAVLRSVRISALSEGNQIELTILDEGRSYRIRRLWTSGLDLPGAEQPGADSEFDGESEVDVELRGQIITLPEGLVLYLTRAESAVDVSAGGLHFYPDGTSSGGRLDLDSPAGRRTILISWLTGEVSLDPQE